MCAVWLVYKLIVTCAHVKKKETVVSTVHSLHAWCSPYPSIIIIKNVRTFRTTFWVYRNKDLLRFGEVGGFEPIFKSIVRRLLHTLLSLSLL